MYERSTVYSGEQPQSSKFMQFERDAAKSLAQFILDAMGSQNAAFTGLAATPGTGLTVNIGAGAVYQYGQIDPTAWGDTMGTDAFDGTLLGLVLSTQNLTGFAAPTTAGDSISYLVQCQIQVTDAAAVSTPFYSSNNNPPTYVQKSPSRKNVVVFEVKAGAQAPTGTQTTPTPDSGWIPLYSVTVDYGETGLTSADIVAAVNSPAFYGFVHTNPNGNTPVFLSPAAQQTGNINVGGTLTAATLPATFGNSSTAGGVSVSGDGSGAVYFTTLHGGSSFVFETSGSTNTLLVAPSTGTITIPGSIQYNGTHAGTDADPYPLSQLNVAMLGGKAASDYALASGHYLILYSGTPTADPTNVNAAIGGYFQANVAQGTAPIQVVSTTMCPNLNAQFVGGYSPGNASGNIPISNGTLNSNLNAQYLNGLASSAFQPAGTYAEMNVVNSGSLECSNGFSTTGNTASTQSELVYSASNGYGINGGGAATLLESINTPLGLIASSTQTSGPLYVGGATPKNAYAQDVVPSGLVRSGMCVYTVTYGGSGNSYPRPGNGTPYGNYGSIGGQIHLSADTVSSSQFWIGYRTKITLNASLTVTFAGVGTGGANVYVDGVSVGYIGGAGNPISSFSHTLSSGTHTVDIVYVGVNMGPWYYLGQGDNSHTCGGNLTVFGWIPFSNGQISSSITSIIPG